MSPLRRVLSPTYAFLLIVVAVQTATASSPTFRDPTGYVAGPQPQTAQVADLNHDGKPDLVEVNQCCGANQNTVGVLLGNGDGTFGAATFYSVGKSPTWVAIADLNGDGISDLAVSNAGSTGASVSVLLGNGDGTFKIAVSYSAGTTCQYLAAADLNGDGKVDLAVANKGSNNISILLGNGDGTFKGAVNYSAGSSPNALVIVDLNNDGKLDLAVADNVSSSSNSLQVLLGNGDGTFQAAVASTGSANATSITAGDFDRDGNQDVVVNNSTGNKLTVLLGSGDGGFKSRQSVTVGFKPTGVAVGDLNHDGKLDLAAADHGTYMISIAIGNGDGSFQVTQDFPGGGRSISLADCNGDGNLDTVSANGILSEIDVALGNGNGTLLQDTFTALPGESSLGVVVADNNKDGIPDVIAPEYSANTLDVYLGNGDGTFQTPHKYPAGTGPRNPAMADFNHDGILDFAVLNCPSFGSVSCSLAVLLGNADGSFQAPAFTSFVGTGETLDLYAGDLNGDGYADIVLPNYTTNTLDVVLGNGDGTFQPAVSYAVESRVFRAALGDFNQDGHRDVAVGGGGGTGKGYVDIFLGKGDGTFLPPTTVPLSFDAAGIAAGDLNGDGKMDIVVSIGEQVQVILGNGDGTFTIAGIFAAPADSQNIAMGDVNGDGKVDVVTAGGLLVGALLGNGDGTLQPSTLYRVAGESTQLAVADFNRDGASDIVYSLGGFGVVLNDAGTTLAASSTPNPSTLQQTVTLTATVTPTFAGMQTPTGSVKFQDGTTVLGTASVSNGQAVLYTTFTTAGTHTITPSYSGDSHYNPHTGTSIGQSVLSPKVNLRPINLNFGDQKVGTTSNPQSVTLANGGAGTLLISDITISGDYTQTNNCPASLPRNVSCSITVTFTPTAKGQRPGSVTITDNATNSPQKVMVKGNGT
jgi:Bacterial Ig-like domain (group 3)/FG-GAP-like repeat/Abnormal spindle-like microcephaly-assoc'd, ASPM-SPD-2-Hydin